MLPEWAEMEESSSPCEFNDIFVTEELAQCTAVRVNIRQDLAKEVEYFMENKPNMNKCGFFYIIMSSFTCSQKE